MAGVGIDACVDGGVFPVSTEHALEYVSNSFKGESVRQITQTAVYDDLFLCCGARLASLNIRGLAGMRSDGLPSFRCLLLDLSSSNLERQL